MNLKIFFSRIYIYVSLPNEMEVYDNFAIIGTQNELEAPLYNNMNFIGSIKIIYRYK